MPRHGRHMEGKLALFSFSWTVHLTNTNLAPSANPSPSPLAPPNQKALPAVWPLPRSSPPQTLKKLVALVAAIWDCFGNEDFFLYLRISYWVFFWWCKIEDFFGEKSGLWTRELRKTIDTDKSFCPKEKVMLCKIMHVCWALNLCTFEKILGLIYAAWKNSNFSRSAPLPPPWSPLHPPTGAPISVSSRASPPQTPWCPASAPSSASGPGHPPSPRPLPTTWGWGRSRQKWKLEQNLVGGLDRNQSSQMVHTLLQLAKVEGEQLSMISVNTWWWLRGSRSRQRGGRLQQAGHHCYVGSTLLDYLIQDI